VDWMHMAQDRDQWSCVHGNEPSGSTRGRQSIDWV